MSEHQLPAGPPLLNPRDLPVIRSGYGADLARATEAALVVVTFNDLREVATWLRAIADRMDHTADIHEGYWEGSAR